MNGTRIKWTVGFAVLSVFNLHAEPGFYKAVFTGSAFDTTSEVIANASGIVLYPEEMYATSLPAYTTVAWVGYMLMSGSVTYNFKGCYDDYVAVKIDDSWVLSKGGECVERTGSFATETTGWYKVEFRVGNNGGVGACQNSSQYGILWNTNGDTSWKRVSASDGNGIFCTLPEDLSQLRVSKTTPLVLSSSIRKNDPTILDVTYTVLSPNNTVNVRALAFEDGERSFWKAVRAETFVKDQDGNETSTNLGDGIAANVPHNLSWKVSADWKTDLAKVKFEVLTSDAAQLQMKLANIEARGNSPSLTVAYGTQTDNDIFNAMLWHYADGADDLVNTDGYVDTTNGIRLVDRTTIPNRLVTLRYVYDKMGFDALIGGNLLSYARRATRKDLQYNSSKQNSAVLRSSKPESLYIGEKAYCVVDLSSGAYSESYPVSYLDSEPVDGWSDEYKTTKLVLRRIDPGLYEMQGNRQVTLTKPFYIGIFTVTQKQYELITGTNPSTNVSEKQPVEVTWNEVRGDSTIYDWPTVKSVSPNSFIGKIQMKTGLTFDLPTEAQWEYACRAGESASYNNGGNTDNDLVILGNYSLGHPLEVGLFVPNSWGLYDMHGNIAQLCLDHHAALNADPVVDPVGPVDGVNRVIRGHYYANFSIKASDSNARIGCPVNSRIPNLNYGGWSSWIGFRLSLTIED